MKLKPEKKFSLKLKEIKIKMVYKCLEPEVPNVFFFSSDELQLHVSTKHLMIGPKGNSEFCFPETLNVPQGEAKGNIEG